MLGLWFGNYIGLLNVEINIKLTEILLFKKYSLKKFSTKSLFRYTSCLEIAIDIYVE